MSFLVKIQLEIDVAFHNTRVGLGGHLNSKRGVKEITLIAKVKIFEEKYVF